MSAVSSSNSSSFEPTNTFMPFRIVYERDYTKTTTKIQFILLNGREAGYTDPNFVINKVINSANFCVVGFTTNTKDLTPDAHYLVPNRVSLPINHYPNFAISDPHKKLPPIQFLFTDKDGTLKQMEAADLIIINAFTDDEQTSAICAVTRIFSGYIEKNQREESTLSSSELSSRVSAAPVTPKSKGGFWSRLFNKNS